ncbi:MAG: hypothetical protein V3V35_04160 [Dehalococcoidia bacterium]
MADQGQKLGEVVEADTAGFLAQCDRLGQPPDLGTLVTTADGDVQLYAVVCHAVTAGIDPSRPVTALGKDEVSDEAIYQTHPELTQLLRTDFRALVVGHRTGESVVQRLPPRPAPIHRFVYQATQQQVREFTQALDFLAYLVQGPPPAGDDATAACLRLASQSHPDRREFLVRAGKALARLLAQDLQRLQLLLQRLGA